MEQLAMAHARSGDREQAASEFDEVLSLGPEFPALKLEYARVALEMGNAERAQNLARSVLQTHPAYIRLVDSRPANTLERQQ